MPRSLLAIFISVVACSPQDSGNDAHSIGSFDTLVLRHFYKGNLHAHSNRSDGDSAPEEVLRWYRGQGYHFAALTDHNVAALEGEYSDLEDEVGGRFRVLGGEEVSWWSESTNARGRRVRVPVHVNALCSERTIGGRRTKRSVNEALGRAFDEIHRQNAVALINHPNFGWALSAGELLSRGPGAALMEIANQHPHVHNGGDADHGSVEELWDQLLSAGRLVYGVADDDLHDLRRTRDELGFNPRGAGRGWVQVAVRSLTPRAICDALEQGRFYASTGVTLDRIATQGDELALQIRPTMPGNYVTQFIGHGGRLLALERGLHPRYRLRGGEGYVRAKVFAPDTTVAWTQPVPVRGANGALALTPPAPRARVTAANAGRGQRPGLGVRQHGALAPKHRISSTRPKG